LSVKYQRVKQQDWRKPKPWRWLTRTFSSIRLAVVLMCLIMAYSILGSLPLRYLLMAMVLALGGLATLFATLTIFAAAIHLTRRCAQPARSIVVGLVTLFGLAMALWGGYTLAWAVYAWLSHQPALAGHLGDTIRRLPWLEMTTLAFYAWWPMQLLLGLLVVNLIWATIRRVEWTLPNAGVLTVHAGIVVVALGSMVYGRYKIEGDALLKRADLGGDYVAHFYDANTPALYIARDSGNALMTPLPELPRYNDYPVGSLDMALHEQRFFDTLVSPNLRMTIPGFYAYARPTLREGQPMTVPPAKRQDEHEGRYTRSLLPVQLELNRPASEGGPWQHTVWLSFMRYPDEPRGRHQPKRVKVPGLGTIKLTFSRQRKPLPFAMQLRDFEMQPYPGSDLPRDFIATLAIVDLGPNGQRVGEPTIHQARLNKPVIYHPKHASLAMQRVKLSQNGWDPPQPSEPNPQARNAEGRLINQQTYAMIGVSNNVAIRVIFAGGVMIVAGIPWAFFVKPRLQRRQVSRSNAKAHQPREKNGQSPQNPSSTPSAAGGEAMSPGGCAS
jgi:hypothetical protein